MGVSAVQGLIPVKVPCNVALVWLAVAAPVRGVPTAVSESSNSRAVTWAVSVSERRKTSTAKLPSARAFTAKRSMDALG